MNNLIILISLIILFTCLLELQSKRSYNSFNKTIYCNCNRSRLGKNNYRIYNGTVVLSTDLHFLGGFKLIF